MFENKKLYKEFIVGVKEGKYNIANSREVLSSLPISVIREIARDIIYSSDSYAIYRQGEMARFDELERWQKESYIAQRLYLLR